MPTCPSCEAEINEGAKFCTFCGSMVPQKKVTEDDPLIGRIFARNFRVEKLLGVGGMGRVYKAIQISLDKPVVLKLLHPQFAGDDNLVHRFHREARAASRLNHANSISIIDFGQDDDGTLFMAMEYLSGRDLFEVLQEESPLPEARIAHLVIQVCSALAEAHDQGVIHRDLKPENIMVEDRRTEKDFVKVLDFGIAKIQDPGGKETRALTAQGMVCGTPEYMAPEQARGEELDPRADIYALGVLLYQMVTGQLPFQAENAIGIVTKHITAQPVPPREVAPDRNISEAMESLILRCMSKRPEERPQTALELSQALAPFVQADTGAMVAGATASATEQIRRASGAEAVRIGSGAMVPPGRNRAVQIGGGAALALVVGGVIWVVNRGPADSVPAPVGTIQVDAAGPEPVDPKPVDPRPADPEPTDPKPTDPKPTDPDPADPKPADPKPTNPRPADPKPVPDPNHNKPGLKPGPGARPDQVAVQVERQHLESLLRKGDARRAAGDYNGALDFYQKARAQAPKDPQVHLKLGMTYYNAGRYQEACSSLRTYTRLKPSERKKYQGVLQQVCSK